MRCNYCDLPLEYVGRNQFGDRIYHCSNCDSYFIGEDDKVIEETDLSIEDIAEIEVLELTETTTGLNGYPQKLKKALVGFESFKQFEEVRERFNLKSVELTKRDGQQLWNRLCYNIYKPYGLGRYNGDECCLWYNINADSFKDNKISELKSNFEELITEFGIPDEELCTLEKWEEHRGTISILCEDEYNNSQLTEEEEKNVDKWYAEVGRLENELNKIKTLSEHINSLSDDEVVIEKNGEYYETSDIHVLKYHDDDVTSFAIALILE